MPVLTSHLLSLDNSAFEAATQHPWLALAGTSRLSKPALLAWLAQDRLYALSYVSFIGSLLSKTSLSSTADRAETLEWRVASTLIDALTNIRREIGMFEHVLRSEFAWSEGGERATTETRAYQGLFAGSAAPHQSLLVGMTALWATEKCYLEAWRFAAAQQSDEHVDPAKGDVMQTILIPNWTNAEFEQFVDAIGTLVDELAKDIPHESSERNKCEDVWKQVLWAEKNFWPTNI